MRMKRLRGKTIGIVGFGRIGQAVAVKARAFGLNVLASDPVVPTRTVESFGGLLVDQTTLLRESDFVSLHAPLTPETQGMIGTAELEAMKQDAFIINAARGPLIDEDALYQALVNGQIAGAGLDVMADNIPDQNHPLIGLDNTIITPHVAFFSQEATLELERRAAGEVVSVLQGKMPDNLVNSAVLEHPNPRHSLSRS